MIRAVIFDMDGLMFDTERVGGICIMQSAREFGYTVTPEMHIHLLGKNAHDNEKYLKSVLGQEFPYKKCFAHVFELMDQYYEEHGMPVKKGLVELLKYLKAHNIQTAVASSSSEITIKKYLENTDLTQYFDYIVGGNQIHHGKPDPEIFMRAVDHFQIRPEDALVLEDSESGILAAHKGKIPVICIPDLVHHRPEIADLTWHTLPSLDKVIDVLEREK